MQHTFRGKIYHHGINWCVDVPRRITDDLAKRKGYIRIKGTINTFAFIQTLVPVKGGMHRLFVNGIMMKGGVTAVGKTALFIVEQNTTALEKQYPMPALLLRELKARRLSTAFDAIPTTRKKDILKYLFYIKTEATLQRNIAKVIAQLKERAVDIRIP